MKYLEILFEVTLIICCALQNIKRFRAPIASQAHILPKNGIDSKKLFILGNGPSLSKDIKNYHLSEKNCILLALNKFCLMQEFFALKPSIYVLPDRRFWDPNYSDKDEIIQRSIFQSFNKVNWQIELIVPQEAFKYYTDNIYNANFITVTPYIERSLPVRSERISVWALYWKICTPIPINSLVIGLWFGLHKKLEEIIILGADFDFFKGLETDQATNTVSFTVNHFYGKDSNTEKPLSSKDQNKPFHVRLSQVSSAFQQLHILERYSKRVGVKIYNGSSFSLIDAYSRC